MIPCGVSPGRVINEMRNGVNMHTISLVVEVVVKGGVLTPDENTKELMWFNSFPDNVVKEQKNFWQNL